MIRRVTRQPGPAGLTVAALPPGTVTEGPVNLVYMDPAGLTVSQAPGTPLFAADGAQYVQAGPASWGQLAMAGRP